MAKKNVKRLDPRAFIKAWQTSETLKEVCEKTGLSMRSIRFRGFFYRRKNLKLKTLRHGNFGDAVYDWKALAAYADSFKN